ncbi:MAG: NAD(P)-dependent oxidoreductase [Burkholderiales bacterium]|nr:NAD(P)-dependent oxidoreductase [Burkholderiales bacterium]
MGLGIMGGAFARHLLAGGFAVTGFDIAARPRVALKKLGGTPAASVATVCSGCTILVTSLPSVSAVNAAYFSKGGIVESAKRGTIVIETSTLSLKVKHEIRERCEQRGIVVLDCPISGTGAQAAVRDIAIYASGDRKAYVKAEAVLKGFSRSVYYCGEYGNGSRLKYVANLLVTIHNLSTAEAMVMGLKSGLDLELLYKVIKDGAGTSRMFEVRGPLMIANDYRKATMKIEVYKKDIDIIEQFAADLHCPVPLFEAAKPFYAAAHAQGRALEDTAAVCAVLEQMAGVQRNNRNSAATRIPSTQTTSTRKRKTR